MLSNLSEKMTSATPGNVTDKKGNFFEMIEYLPYGETLYDEAATVDKTEFRFTSKEQDAETGLYYHGARYRDAKTGVWLSVDPYLANGKYFPVPPVNDKAKERNKNLPGMGGVFNSVNLNAYQYAGNNPVRFVDPDGKTMDVLWVWDRITRADSLARLLDGVLRGEDRAQYAFFNNLQKFTDDMASVSDQATLYLIVTPYAKATQTTSLVCNVVGAGCAFFKYSLSGDNKDLIDGIGGSISVGVGLAVAVGLKSDVANIKILNRNGILLNITGKGKELDKGFNELYKVLVPELGAQKSQELINDIKNEIIKRQNEKSK